jgi:membrane associated rhomboid family serine protease
MHTQELTDILLCPGPEEGNELALVLAAQAIQAQVRWNGHDWVLSVPDDSVARARLELAAYATELKLKGPPRPPVWTGGKPWPGLAVYCAVLVLMALVAPAMSFGVDWLTAGRMDGARMQAGEWWRPVTALMLHADAPHLLGNLLFGGFFGYTVCLYFGAGFGWLAIVIAGALGNLANGYLAGPEHLSIGASTAVFAALGLLSAYLWRVGFPAAMSRRERFAPVIAGIGLLAFTGTGGVDTDIGAHLLGFVAGFGGGLIIAGVGVPTGRRAQQVSAAAAAAIVVLAWGAAIS